MLGKRGRVLERDKRGLGKAEGWKGRSIEKRTEIEGGGTAKRQLKVKRWIVLLIALLKNRGLQRSLMSSRTFSHGKLSVSRTVKHGETILLSL